MRYIGIFKIFPLGLRFLAFVLLAKISTADEYTGFVYIVSLVSYCTYFIGFEIYAYSIKEGLLNKSRSEVNSIRVLVAYVINTIILLIVIKFYFSLRYNFVFIAALIISEHVFIEVARRNVANGWLKADVILNIIKNIAWPMYVFSAFFGILEFKEIYFICIYMTAQIIGASASLIFLINKFPIQIKKYNAKKYFNVAVVYGNSVFYAIISVVSRSIYFIDKQLTLNLESKELYFFSFQMAAGLGMMVDFLVTNSFIANFNEKYKSNIMEERFGYWIKNLVAAYLIIGLGIVFFVINIYDTEQKLFDVQIFAYLCGFFLFNSINGIYIYKFHMTNQRFLYSLGSVVPVIFAYASLFIFETKTIYIMAITLMLSTGMGLFSTILINQKINRWPYI